MAPWFIVLIVSLVFGTLINLVLEVDPLFGGNGFPLPRLRDLSAREVVGPYALIAFPGFAVAFLDGVMNPWAVILLTTLLVGTGFLLGPKVAVARNIGAATNVLWKEGPLVILVIYLDVSGVALGFVALFRWLS